MATSLFAITNSTLEGKENIQNYQRIKQSFKKLSNNSKYFQEEQISEEINWNYEISAEREDEPFNIYFDSSYHLSPQLYPECGLIFCPYNYSLLYETKNAFWLEDFRKELFDIIAIIGGTEVIYLADNGCDKLSGFLAMVWEGQSYRNVKDSMYQEFGRPVIDYNKLDYEKLDYNNIKEFFLDDFSDLKK